MRRFLDEMKPRNGTVGYRDSPKSALVGIGVSRNETGRAIRIETSVGQETVFQGTLAL